MKTLYKLFAGLLSTVLVILTIALCVELFFYRLLPNKLLLIVFGILLLLDIIFIVLMLTDRSFFTKFVVCILTIAISAVYCLGGFYLYKTMGTLSNITGMSGSVKNVQSVIVKNDSGITSLEQLNGQTVGKLANMDTEGSSKCLEDIAQTTQVATEDYEDVMSMVDALYAGEVQAIILNKNFLDSVSENETYANFRQETTVIHETTYEKEQVVSTDAVGDIAKEPFNILISGSDSRGGINEVARSDVNMVVTVNPKTGIVLLTSIPRDFYVATACTATQNCNQGAMDKLTHTGIYGVSCTKETVENLLGIKINYTLRVGFDAVERLVDAVGGIDVNLKPGYEVGRFHTDDAGVCVGVHEGVNHLNGACALAYSRERYAYGEGDRQRAKNQQEVLMQIANKAMSFTAITNFTNLLDSINGYFETDLSYNEIQDLIKAQVINGTKWKFEQYSVDGAGASDMCAALGNYAYVMVPYEITVETANKKINAVLNGQSSDTITEG